METNRSVLRLDLARQAVRLICRNTPDRALLGEVFNADSTLRNKLELDATELDADATNATLLEDELRFSIWERMREPGSREVTD